MYINHDIYINHDDIYIYIHTYHWRALYLLVTLQYEFSVGHCNIRSAPKFNPEPFTFFHVCVTLGKIVDDSGGICHE